MKVQLKGLCLFCNLGDWSNGMIGVSKTFGGGSIPSSPVSLIVENLEESRLSAIFLFLLKNIYLFERNTHYILSDEKGGKIGCKVGSKKWKTALI